ncbi:DUF7331 family protein [Halomarina litorea]|uniref:DUF7331 family protein n=1 Tax=Halomarina litorea TaxID=2961595 RepID=UPI0020C27BE1|nr:hypothetical protein [Halomarina sp. BCD28]
MTYTHHPPDLHREDEPTSDQDVALTLTGGRVLLYDSRNHRAWIVSSASVVLSDAA